ncbi:MAG: sulfatase-like hydrolase/transferase, partial [Planctomycetota bacterium]
MTIRDEELVAWPREPAALREEIARYDLMIENMDRGIGRVLATLDRHGLTEDTLVVFAGDHGLALGSHGLLGKQNLYEHSMRSPLVIAGPGFPEGETRDDFAYLHDLPPTILAGAGVEIPETMDGLDLHHPTSRSGVLTRYRDLQRAWRDDRWKVIWYPRIDRWQVFDLAADPDEQVD